MPSFRLISALAIAAFATRPARSFLVPPTPPPSTSTGAKASSSSPAISAVRSRVQRSTSSAHGRNSAAGPLMMAKKKGAAKRKAAASAAKKKVAAARSNPATASSSSAAGPATAVAEAPSSGTSSSSTADTAADEQPPSVILNRASDAEPVALPPQDQQQPTAEAVVNGAGDEKESLSKSKQQPAGAKGFGAPVAEPRPMQKGLNKAPPAAPKPAAGQGQGQGRGGVGARTVSEGLPPPKQTVGGAGMDALAPGVPVAGNTDHQRVIEDLEFTDPESAITEASGRAEGEMSPAEMLKYLRDNNLSIDLETMNPVEIPTDPVAKLEAVFPFPAANVMAEHNVGTNAKPSDFVARILPLLPADEPWNGAKIRPLPDLKDFLLANRFYGGHRALNVVTSMMLKAMGKGDLERAKMLKGAGICLVKAENTITGPFRQAVMFAENRLAPNMGSTLSEEYAGSDAVDAAATWVVLKACVAEWELRLREVRQEEIGLHDIFRAIPNPTEGLDEERTAAITGSVQAMGLAFSENEKLIKSLPLEIQFLEGSLGLNTTTAVRRYALQEFCPQEGISPEELRFRVRSVICGLEQLPTKSYHQIMVSIEDVYDCLVEGTPDEYNIYTDNWDQGENLSFETYRVDTGEKWRDRLREIVTKPIPEREEKDGYERLIKEVLPKSLYDMTTPADEASEEYTLPFKMVKKGWWTCLDYLDADKMADKKMREAEVEEQKRLEEEVVIGKDGEKMMDDIFTDVLTEETKLMEEFVFSKEDFEGDEDILDGPGPGMVELDLGF